MSKLSDEFRARFEELKAMGCSPDGAAQAAAIFEASEALWSMINDNGIAASVFVSDPVRVVMTEPED